MKTKTFSLLAITIFAWITLGQSNAATIPAGTTLVVRTLEPISSDAPRGRQFLAQLETSVTVNGKVLLPAGTKVLGRVETSRRMATTSHPLTVNLTDVQLGGRNVPVKTTGACQLVNWTTARGVAVSNQSYVVASGRKMEFRLAHSLHL